MALPAHPQTINVATRFPFYRPGGLPLYWRDEVTGVLTGAVKAYFEHTSNSAQLELLIGYLRHVICAPCWNTPARYTAELGDDEMAAALIQLRLDIVEGRVKTPQQIDAWIMRCLDIGIDPL